LNLRPLGAEIHSRAATRRLGKAWIPLDFQGFSLLTARPYLGTPRIDSDCFWILSGCQSSPRSDHGACVSLGGTQPRRATTSSLSSSGTASAAARNMHLTGAITVSGIVAPCEQHDRAPALADHDAAEQYPLMSAEVRGRRREGDGRGGRISSRVSRLKPSRTKSVCASGMKRYRSRRVRSYYSRPPVQSHLNSRSHRSRRSWLGGAGSDGARRGAELAAAGLVEGL
jgi:hypothetical protein